MANPQTNPQILDAQNQIGAGQFDAAISSCLEVYRADPNNIDALNVLAIAYACSGQAMKSVEVLSELVTRLPEVVKYKTNFAKAIGMLRVQTETTDKAEQIKRAISICLEDEQISHKVFLHVWYALLMQDKALAALTLAVENGDAAVDLDAVASSLSEPFLHLGLKRLIAAGGVQFERLMTFLRRHFLLHDEYDAQVSLPFLCALAEQCYLNEYVYAVSDEERGKVAAMVGELNALPSLDMNDPSVMAKVALVGCYQDIDREVFAQKIGASSDDAFSALVGLLITSPSAVRALQADIPVLSSISDDVSSSVRDQYEDNPYPRWRCLTAPALTEADRAKGQGRSILIAGCGTGQEILNMALYYPEADITGIDLSTASLAYGKQKAVELGIENVSFMQADILEIEALDQQFDMVVSSGVLHHMKDPVLGWKKLLTRLKPGGVMKVALYSQIARRYVIQCQDWIKEQGYPATPQGISDFRQAVMAMDDDNPLKVMEEPIDFYSMSMCRDLLFHVQEHVYTLPQIEAVLGELDLELLSLKISQPGVLQKYRAQFPDDPGAVNLSHWHAFEQQNPETFVGMYPLWCARKGDGLSGVTPEWVFIDRN